MLVDFNIEKGKQQPQGLSTILSRTHIKKFTKVSWEVVKYEQEVKLFIKESQANNSLTTAQLDKLASHLHAITLANDSERKFAQTVFGCNVDEVNELDKIGSARYSRTHQITYDFSDMLDIIISELFYIDRHVVRSKLAQSAHTRGFNYNRLSAAILSQDELVLDNLDMGVFFDIHPRIDQYLYVIGDNLTKETIKDVFGKVVDISKFNLTEEQKFNTFFYVLILRYLHTLMNVVIAEFYQGLRRQHGADILLTSIGFSNLVIQSEKPIAQDLTIKFTDNETTITPIVAAKGQYYKEVIKQICYS